MERQIQEKPKGTPLTDEVVQQLIKRGYKAVDLVYFGQWTKEAILAITPKDLSEMADLYAEHDDNLLGC